MPSPRFDRQCLTIPIAKGSFSPSQSPNISTSSLNWQEQVAPEYRELLGQVRLDDFVYDLPAERIPESPLKKRDQARQLVYRSGEINHQQFFELPQQLPADSVLVFNDTKVIRARLYAYRATGAKIEVLLLNPHTPAAVEQAMSVQGGCIWQCVIGNRKKWKPGEVLEMRLGEDTELKLQLIDRERNLVQFNWTPAEKPFVQLLHEAGELPLPPYLQRKPTAEDLIQYQTVYAQKDGAVAAPTAGLHFTDRVLEGLAEKGIAREFVTLHVSAGTFLPVKTEHVIEHDMHAEQMIVKRDSVSTLLAQTGPIIPVGTTSLRWLESLYWLGVNILSNNQPAPPAPWLVDKLDPYRLSPSELPDRNTALQAILSYMDAHGLSQMFGDTELLIVPGYPFRMISGLITNFHMPETTLMLLVAALVGDDWRKIYEAALAEGYRFLSYGDSSLLLPKG